ncbi:hypothetical protein [Roseisolibacter sp. H3M3-2]|uniref:hypothetical protein n=1 Tax=Roseisolibacter sp. H3M3-2 TaxID=3031323 RepID=UPI0023DC08E8|nr:hypothetical protein [Roseisolibacter sp. H3M3-2]MDF1501788.1 hypothetical protein [Roseisolibacter sp. H3M3-2]
MISTDVETRALQFLAEDEFCSPFEIATVVVLWDADPAATGALVAAWQERGWVELLSQDEPDLPDLLHLTEAGYAEVERRRPVS